MKKNINKIAKISIDWDRRAGSILSDAKKILSVSDFDKKVTKRKEKVKCPKCNGKVTLIQNKIPSHKYCDFTGKVKDYIPNSYRPLRISSHKRYLHDGETYKAGDTVIFQLTSYSEFNNLFDSIDYKEYLRVKDNIVEVKIKNIYVYSNGNVLINDWLNIEKVVK